MSTRRFLPLALAALAGCPSVERQEPPASIAVATFDPNTSTIPLPNDLALQRAPAQSGVQRELLLSFVAGGGFPADQEVAITIPIAVKERQADGNYGTPCPGVPTSRCGTPPTGVDLATVNDDNVALVRIDTSTAQRLPRCATPPTAECWEPGFANGQLTLRRAAPDGSRRWPAGARYAVATRAGAIKTASGLTVEADTPITLVIQGKDLTARENQPPGGLPPATATQLEQVRGLYATPRAWGTVTSQATCQAALGAPVPLCWLPAPTTALPAAFDAVAPYIPVNRIASIQTFTVQPAPGARPLVDTGSGQLPLPSDFLLEPVPNPNNDPALAGKMKVRNVPAFGAAAAGLETLDGFSTTAPLLIPLSAPADATTITPETARVFDLSSGAPVPVVGLSLLPGAPAPSGAPQILVQPPTAISNGRATSIVLAPAVPIEAGPTRIYLPPLKEKTRYLVLVTNGVKDASGQPLKRSTIMDLVFSFTGPLFDAASGKSLVSGVAAADAAGLQALRNGLGPVLDALSLRSCANNAPCAVLAYTVTTQSVRDVTKLLSAASYGIEKTAAQAAAAAGQPPQAIFSPIAGTTSEFTLPAALGITATMPNVVKVLRTTFPSVNAIQGSTGAFDPAFATWTPAQVQQHLQPIAALVAVPNPALVPTPCPAPAAALKCAPLVVYQHGLWGSTWQMLAVADALAARGIVVAAIDMPYHGERSFCKANDECVQANGAAGVCTPNPALQTPADTVAPGTCTTGTFAVNPSLYAQKASGNYFVSSNFFRTRDAFRQYVFDVSALTLALARPPAAAYPIQPSSNELATALGQAGVAIDPTRVYFAGFSTGGIGGVAAVATNPRFKRASLTESGGTVVDVFTQAPANQDKLPAIFGPLGIDLTKVSPTVPGGGANPAFDPAQAAKYAQTLAVAKWILDPAEPLNYADKVPTKDLHPDLAPLTTGNLVGSTTTERWGQLVTGAETIPNQNARELYTLAGIPASGAGAFATYTSAGAVPSGERHNLFIRNFLDASSPLQQGGDAMRADLATFLATGAAPSPSPIP